MMQSKKEYATALFILASEENCRDEIFHDLTVVRNAFEEHAELQELLSSPAIAKSERLGVIDAVFGSLGEYTVSFLKLLCEKQMIHGLKDMADEFENMLEASRNLTVAKVTSAVALTEKELKALKEKLETMCGHTVVIETSVDETILGGMVIVLDDKVIDASLRHRLSDVKEVISR